MIRQIVPENLTLQVVNDGLIDLIETKHGALIHLPGRMLWELDGIIRAFMESYNARP